MKTKTLQQAKSLQDKIDELKQHYKKIKTDTIDPFYRPDHSNIFIESIDSGHRGQLLQRFLPIPIYEYVEQYLINVDKEIERLEKKLEKL